MSENCPLCDHPLAAGMGLRVDVLGCVVAANGKSVRVTPQQASLLFALAEKYPAEVRRDLLIRKLWGAKEPRAAHNQLSVQVHRCRRVTRYLGYELESVRNGGYALAPIKS